MHLMARGLARAGCEVHVATTDDNDSEKLDVPLGVPLVDESVTYWHFRRQTRFYGFSWPLTRWLARHVRDYDLVHAHALFSYATIPAAYFARQAGVPYVIRPLGVLNRWGINNRRPWLKRLSFMLVERRILAGAYRIHFTSEEERIEAEELGVKQRAIVIPLGIDLGPFEELPPRGWLRARAPHLDGRAVALFLSRIDPKKGLDLLLHALARAKAMGTRLALVIAGSGDRAYESALRREARTLGVDRDVVWAGFVTGQDKRAVLAEADLFVLPSRSENFAVSVVEAMACGLPVVISNQIGIHREVTASGAGFAVPCRVDALVETLVRLAADPMARRELGSRGRHLARDRFSVETMTSGLLGLYSSLTAPATAARGPMAARG
jgi:glycosyltransferase involved in cell wall biosynthesis